MQKFVFLGLLLLMLTAVVEPQERDEVFTPSVEDYLKAVPELAEAWQTDIPLAYGKTMYNPLIKAMIFELEHSYSPEEIFAQDFETLLSAYDALSVPIFGYSQIDYPSQWALSMLEVWLQEHPTDLSQVEHLEIPAYDITVSPIDLNNDGIDEFWLQTILDNLKTILVLQHDPSQPAGYRFVETPLDWADTSRPDYASELTDFDVIHFGDVTGDNIPEWLIFQSHYPQCGRLFILSWQDERLVNLLTDGPVYCLPNDFAIENSDDDPALEITQVEQKQDNWRCDFTITHQVDWDGSRFISPDDHLTFADTLGCALREAEPLMWEGHVSEAIPLYEAGLAGGWNDSTDTSSVYIRELNRYARLRLALAYALQQRVVESRTILTDLAAEPSTSQLLDAMISAMLDEDSSLGMCTAAYNVWAEQELLTFHYIGLPITAQVGRQSYINGMMDDFPSPAEKAACDAPHLINTLLETHSFTTHEDPEPQLKDLGIEVLETFAADFNGDRADEWLIWLTARVDPILFVPHDGTYILSRPAVRRPSEFTQFGLHIAPDQEQRFFVDYALMNAVPPNIEYHTYDIPMVYCEETSNLGSVSLWRFEDEHLIQILDAPLCETRSFDELFSADGQQFFAAAEVNSRYTDGAYTWSSIEQTYLPPTPQSASNTTEASGMPPFTDAELFEKFDRVLDLLRADQAEQALFVIEDALVSHDPDANAIVIEGLHAYRALALTALHHPDHALTEYTMLSESTPDSVWGRFARLHLKRS